MEDKILQLAAKLGAARNRYEELRVSLMEAYDFTRHMYATDPGDILKQLTELNETISDSHTTFNELIKEYAKIVGAELDAIDVQEPVNVSYDGVEPYFDDRELLPALA